MEAGYAGIAPFSLDITYFKLAFEFRSISGAARKIGQDPASLSRLISRLERRTGMTLFVRHRAGLQATDEGRRLYEAVARAEEQFFRRLGPETKRAIRIGFSPPVGYSHFTPAILDKLLGLPTVPEFVIEPTGALVERIKQRSLDFALVASEVRTPGVISRRVALEGIALCSRGGRPARILAVNPDLLSIERIIPLIRHEERWSIRDYFVLAKFVEDKAELMGLLPETLVRKFPGLRVIRVFPNKAKLTALTWPGSPGVELLRATSSGR